MSSEYLVVGKVSAAQRERLAFGVFQNAGALFSNIYYLLFF